MEARISQSQSQNKKCLLCNLEFSCVSAKNRHMKNLHNQIPNTNARKSHIICPLCTENEIVCGSYNILEEHLKINHGIKLEIETHNFATRESYEQWFEEQKIKTNYVSARSNKFNDYVEKSYNCNRSNSEGYISKCSKRTEKAGGSIKIYGVCPSHLNIKIWQTGETTVKFWKSHVGHEEDIRSQHLSEMEKKQIVSKLSSGVTVERIISDARKMTSETENLQRINILNRKDVSYLMKKHNIMKNKLFSENKSSHIKGHKEETENFVRENGSDSNDLLTIDDTEDYNLRQRTEIANTFKNFILSLNGEAFERVVRKYSLIMEQENKSRKMVKQEFIPRKRKK